VVSTDVLTSTRLPGPLVIGPHHVGTPVVLAPMAGITNAAFRALCRELAGAALADAGLPGHGAGVYVSEMVTSRALVERSPESMRLIEHGPGESPRSVQLYGVDPATVGAAVAMLVDEDRADHVDLNFGCPVPKVTRKGGGSALPWKTALFRDVVRAAVRSAAPAGVPVTIKMRIGVDDAHHTYLDAGRIAQDEGVAAVALHARTAAQHYSGRADWTAIARLKQVVTDVPVLGNGDVWGADDALEMVRQSGCDGVVVGRARGARATGAGSGRGCDAPARRAARRALRALRRRPAGQGVPRDPQARRLVPQGLRGRQRTALGPGSGRLDGRAGRPAGHPRPGPALAR
jgi:nifR3 family TIM-barrel protein